MTGFKKNDLRLFRCPTCREALEWKGTEHQDGSLYYGALICMHNHTWRVESGIPNLADRRRLSTKDQLMDVVYDFLAPVHDLSVTYLLPLLQYPDAQASRNNYIEAMELDTLGEDDKPKKVLEVGVGTGANIPLIAYAARQTNNLEIWAVDLNANMIKKCARAEANICEDSSPLKLALADAHELPFADSTFDRVLHVGGINIYRDAAQGLAEMARVAKPGTPIVVVDEGLDKKRDNTILHELSFLWLTSMDEFTGAPEDLLPDDCELVSVKNVMRFYYCMVFKKKSKKGKVKNK